MQADRALRHQTIIVRNTGGQELFAGGVSFRRIRGLARDQQQRRDVRHVQQLGGAPLGLFRTAVVALGGSDVGMARELLNAGDVGAGVKELAHEASTQVVGEKRGTRAWAARYCRRSSTA